MCKQQCWQIQELFLLEWHFLAFSNAATIKCNDTVLFSLFFFFLSMILFSIKNQVMMLVNNTTCDFKILFQMMCFGFIACSTLDLFPEKVKCLYFTTFYIWLPYIYIRKASLILPDGRHNLLCHKHHGHSCLDLKKYAHTLLLVTWLKLLRIDKSFSHSKSKTHVAQVGKSFLFFSSFFFTLT